MNSETRIQVDMIQFDLLMYAHGYRRDSDRSRALGISAATLSRIRAGKQGASIQTVEAVKANFPGAPIDRIFHLPNALVFTDVPASGVEPITEVPEQQQLPLAMVGASVTDALAVLAGLTDDVACSLGSDRRHPSRAEWVAGLLNGTVEPDRLIDLARTAQAAVRPALMATHESWRNEFA